MKIWRVRPRGPTWHLITFTTVKPPGTSVRTLQDAQTKEARGARAVVEYLKKCCGLERSAVHDETGGAGMVHGHMLAHCRRLTPHQLNVAREIYKSITGAVYMHIEPVKRKRPDGTRLTLAKAVNEVCKYTTKGVAAYNHPGEQVHPALAAMVDVAFRGRQLWREYGDWDSVPFEPPEFWECPMCNRKGDSTQIYLTDAQLRALRAQEEESWKLVKATSPSGRC